MISAFAERLAHLRERIDIACARAGRSPEQITLVAVTKRQPFSAVTEAIAAGVPNVGENYVQEAAEKRALLSDANAAQWHLIGHLQSNKARLAVQTFGMIQSVDSVGLARTLGRHAEAVGKTLDILAQVHLGSEETKSGFDPVQVLDAAAEMATLSGVHLRGLMGIAPAGEEARPYFQQLQGLFQQLTPDTRRTLSMGMTGDFDIAIEEGTTMIRVGTALFGPRTI